MMIGSTSIHTGIGENSNDDCCICGDEWEEGKQGWVLCDSQGCENCVCANCTSSLSLSVSELFYCPICAGSGDSAAATAGGAVATAVAGCMELEKLPLSFKTTRKILFNLLENPEDPKYRKLRLENKSVKQLVDLEPVLNILTSIGFVRTQCARQVRPTQQLAGKILEDLPPTEEVLLLEGSVPIQEIKEFLKILDGLTPEHIDNANQSDSANGTSSSDKRKSLNISEDTTSLKKQKGEGETIEKTND